MSSDTMESVKSRDDDASSVVIVTPAEPDTEVQDVKVEPTKGKHLIYMSQYV